MDRVGEDGWSLLGRYVCFSFGMVGCIYSVRFWVVWSAVVWKGLEVLFRFVFCFCGFIRFISIY